MKRNLLFILVALLPVVASAYDAEIDGIYYNFSSDEAEVTSGWYFETVVIPESVIYDGTTYTVTSIGKNAFYGSLSLTSVTIPNSVTSIGDYAFYDCRHLPFISIPGSVVTIGSDAFNCCYELTSISIPNSVISIGKRAFASCKELTSIIIPDGVTSIEENTFNGCQALTSVIIPNNVTSIDYGAFYNCQALSSVTIPDCVTTIANDAFFNCRSLKSVNIPNNVTTIGKYAFYNCVGLTFLSIGKSVTNIGRNAFKNCVNLTDVYCYAEEVPETEGTVFTFNDDDPIASATLHVPAGSVEKYKATAPWNGFGNIVAIEEPHQPLPFLEGNPIWEYKYEHIPTPRSDDWMKYWLDTGDRIFTYYFLGGQKEIDGKVYTMMGEITSRGEENSITFNRWYPIREENGIVYTITDSLPGIVEQQYNEDYEIPYLQQGNECVLYNFGAKIGDKLDKNNTVKSFDSYQLMDGTECRVLKTGTHYDLYEKLGYRDDDGTYGLIDPLFGIPIATNGHAYVNQLNAFYLDNVMLYKTPDAQEGLCVNDTIRSLDDAYSYASSYKADPCQEEVFSYIRQLQMATQVTYTKGQMATIILPTAPDAGKGKYYRLDKCEDGKIIFEQEKQPQAHIPYIIVPSEDFSIDTSTLDLAGLRPDTVSIAGISFIGSYSREKLKEQEGWYIDIIDTTPDCQAEEGKAYTIGALRAYLTVNWDDPINHDGSKGPGDKLEIVLKDNPNSLNPTLSKGEGDEIVNGKWSNGKWFDLKGRKLSGRPARGIYIEDGKKKVMK